MLGVPTRELVEDIEQVPALRYPRGGRRFFWGLLRCMERTHTTRWPGRGISGAIGRHMFCQ